MPLTTTSRLSTGISGADEILGGGFICGRSYLIAGGSGTGKTTFGLHFLTSAGGNGETSLFVCMHQPETHIRSDANAMDLSLNNVSFLDLTPDSAMFSQMQTYDIFSPAEVERHPVAEEIAAAIARTHARRVYVDGFDEFRYLASNPYQFRRLVQSFFRFIAERSATLLISADSRSANADDELHSTADGVIALTSSFRGRFMRVAKFRGSRSDPHRHPMRITDSGIQVFPL